MKEDGCRKSKKRNLLVCAKITDVSMYLWIVITKRCKCIDQRKYIQKKLYSIV